MQLTNAAARQAHVHARNRFGNPEIVLRYLTRPAAVLDAPRCIVERRPEHLKVTDIRRRRREYARNLVRERWVVGSGIDYAGWIALRVDRALRRFVGVA